MKILGIYDKSSKINCHGKNIFEATSRYLNKFPHEYRVCYDYNMRDLELYRVDEIIDDSRIATYVPDTNVIIFEKTYPLGHEMFHVASEDRLHNKTAMSNKLGVEDGIVEGMTEYFHMKAYYLPEATTYFFHVFCVMMLEDIPNIFKSYFVPTDDTFFTKITDPKLMYSLLYALDVYNDNYGKYEDSIIAGKRDKDLKLIVEESVNEVIDNLITIKLSLCNDSKELNKYGDKFMDLLTSGKLAKTMTIDYPNYINYANNEIKKRIRKKM